MKEMEQILAELSSDDPIKRHDACEELRVAEKLPDHGIIELDKTTSDDNPLVADAARRALNIHTQETTCVEVDKVLDIENNEHIETIRKFYKSIRSWAIGLLVWGGISLVLSGLLNPFWGLILVVVGILSFKIKIPAMFVIYTVILFGAAITNAYAAITGGGANFLWFGAVVIQMIAGIRTAREYKMFRNIPLHDLYRNDRWPDGFPAPQDEFHYASRFGVAGFILSIASVGLFVSLFIEIMILSVLSGPSVESTLMLDWLGFGSEGMAWLSIALCLSSLISSKDKRTWSIAGLITSSLIIFIQFGLGILFASI